MIYDNDNNTFKVITNHHESLPLGRAPSDPRPLLLASLRRRSPPLPTPSPASPSAPASCP